jgi:acetate---CoA ligase (ADP-forming)
MKDHQLANLFAPETIAVIGASRNPEKIGNSIVKNILDSGYKGKVFPINPREKEILGLKCFVSVEDIPLKENGRAAEVAVIAIPAGRVLEAVKDCARSGIKLVIVVSAGFKEIGHEGMELEKELTAFCRNHGIRLIGPNCVGLMHTHSPLNASFARGFPQKGNIAFISQSGAMLVSILDWSQMVGLGFSHFVSLGNKADLNEIDFLEYAAWDPTTRVILCYLEDIVNGQKFLEVASRISVRKPIIILKAGASPEGARAVTSHTGALAGSDNAYNAAFKQSAVFRADSMEELFDMAVAFAQQPLPKGDRIAIVTNSGGPGILTTDQIGKKGLHMARFTAETTKQLREFLPQEASIYNPVDVLGDAGADRYIFAMERVLLDPQVDSVITLLCPTAMTESIEVARAIVDVRQRLPKKPFLAVFMGGKEIQAAEKLLSEAEIPCYTFPERAVAAMAGLVRYSHNATILRQKIQKQGKIRERTDQEKKLPQEKNNTSTVKAIFYDALRERRIVLLGHEGARILNSFGISAAPTLLAREPQDAAEKAIEMGFPVVLKIASPKIMHKSDIGGVVANLNSPDEVQKSFREIIERARRFLPDAPLYGIEVQKMMPPGIEIIIGSSFDLQFGPLLVFGLGGIYVNLFEDVSLRLAQNLDEDDIEEMIRETKAYHLLKGFRGSKTLDFETLKSAIFNLADLVMQFPEIKEMDINPLLIYEEGLSAVDVKITLSHDLITDYSPLREEGDQIPKHLVERRS